VKGYRTKKIALPGGRVIEIVYFADDAEDGASPPPPAAAPAARPPGRAPAREEVAAWGLHVCPECDSELVYPVAWEERSGDTWHIERRCPNCEWRHAGEFAQAEVEDYDDVLNDGTEELLDTLRSFARANMAEDVERLIDAIRSGRIEPMDF
jgi:hypothetical protein